MNNSKVRVPFLHRETELHLYVKERVLAACPRPLCFQIAVCKTVILGPLAI